MRSGFWQAKFFGMNLRQLYNYVFSKAEWYESYRLPKIAAKLDFCTLSMFELCSLVSPECNTGTANSRSYLTSFLYASFTNSCVSPLLFILLNRYILVFALWHKYPVFLSNFNESDTWIFYNLTVSITSRFTLSVS